MAPNINDNYFMMNYHMEKVKALVKNYLKPYGLDYMDYDDLWSKLEEENTRALKRINSKAMALGGNELAKARIKLSKDYEQWKKDNKFE